MAETKNFPFAFIRGRLCRSADAKISIQCKAVQYGLGVFTGIRGNWNSRKKNLFLFRPREHFDRLKEAAKITGMKLKMEYPQFKKILVELIKKNRAKADVYLRPTLYSAAETLTPRFDNPDDDLAIYMISLKSYFGNEGLNMCISSWRRFDDDAISTKAKVTGGYANSALAKTEAVLNGFDEAIFLNRDGKVCEASGANIFGVKDGKVFTPPLSANNLHGITRRSLIELLREELKMEVIEADIDRSTLYCFDEVFLTGTAAKLTWVRSIDHRVIGNGKMGKTTLELQEVFEKAVEGSLPKYEKWCEPIY